MIKLDINFFELDYHIMTEIIAKYPQILIALLLLPQGNHIYKMLATMTYLYFYSEDAIIDKSWHLVTLYSLYIIFNKTGTMSKSIIMITFALMIFNHFKYKKECNSNDKICKYHDNNYLFIVMILCICLSFVDCYNKYSNLKLQTGGGNMTLDKFMLNETM